MLSEPITRALLLLCIPLSTLVSLDGASKPDKLIGPLLLAGWAAVNVLDGRSRFAAPPRRMLLPLAFIALILIALLRTATNNPPYPVTELPLLLFIFGLLALTAFVAMVFLEEVPPNVLRGRLVCVVLAPGVFTVINLLLHLGGVSFGVDPALQGGAVLSGSAVMLAKVHINVQRIVFPLTPGVAGSGAIAMLGLLMAGALASSSKERFRWVAAAIAFVCFAVVMLADARTAVIYGVITVFITWLVPRWGRRAAGWLALLLPLAPFLILWGLSRVSSYADSFSRAGGSDAQTAGGRSDVWQAVFGYLGKFHPQDIIGWGVYGQQRSGASVGYEQIFSTPFSDLNTAHNVALQAILDIGYIGLFVMLGAFAFAIVAAADRQRLDPSPVNLALFMGLVVLMLSGADEASPSIYMFQTIVAWILVALAACRPEFTYHRPVRPLMSYNEQVRQKRERPLEVA